MEVKMFVCNSPQAAEKEVNTWLAQNPVSVSHITQSQSERGGAFIFVLSLFYSKKTVVAKEIQEMNALSSMT
jgi:hypothetical protein